MMNLNKLRYQIGVAEPYKYKKSWNAYKGIAVHFYNFFGLSFTWADAVFISEEAEKKHKRLEVNGHKCSRTGGYHRGKPIIGTCGFSLGWYALSIESDKEIYSKERRWRLKNKIQFRVHPDNLLGNPENYGYCDMDYLYDFSELIE